jgi:hypothetical protein
VEHEEGRVDPSVDAVHPDAQHGEGALVEELRDRIHYLERQVEEERNARYRADELLARLMDRVHLEAAPQEATGGAERGEEEPERADPGQLREGLRRAQSVGHGGRGGSGHDPITLPHARYSPPPKRTYCPVRCRRPSGSAVCRLADVDQPD